MAFASVKMSLNSSALPWPSYECVSSCSADTVLEGRTELIQSRPEHLSCVFALQSQLLCEFLNFVQPSACRNFLSLLYITFHFPFSKKIVWLWMESLMNMQLWIYKVLGLILAKKCCNSRYVSVRLLSECPACSFLTYLRQNTPTCTGQLVFTFPVPFLVL